MKIRLFILLFFIAFQLSAQKINEEQVPKDVLIGLESIYPEAKVKTWEFINGNYFATLKVDGQQGKAELTPEGKWIESRFPVTEKELPSKITKYFYDNYPDFKISTSLFIEEPDDVSYYYLKIQKKGIGQGESGELFFDLAGRLTKSTAPEIVKTEPTENKQKDDVFSEEEAPKSSGKKTKEKEKVKKEPEITKETPKPKQTKEKASKKSKDKDEEKSNFTDVPAIVKKNFDKKFPRVENPVWEQVDSNYVVSFFFRINDQKAEFAPDGKLVSTTTIMDPKNIYRPLENYLMKKYKKYKVIRAEKVIYERTYQKIYPEKNLKNYYYVEISERVKGSRIPKITRLWFDGVGAIDRVVEGDIDDDYDSQNANERGGKYDKKFDRKVGDE
jgi:hypothetical protein